MAKNLGSDFFIQISGYIGKRKIELSATIIMDVKLVDEEDSKLTLTDIMFQIRVGLDDPGLRLECKMKYESTKVSQNPLIFMGKKSKFCCFLLIRSIISLVT